MNRSHLVKQPRHNTLLHRYLSVQIGAFDIHALEDQLDKAKRVTQRGDVAGDGAVAALRNLVPLDRVLRTSFVERATAGRGVPDAPGIVPPLLPRVEPLHRVVPVDAYLPGCPPSAELIWQALLALLEGRLPADGAAAATAPRFG